MKYVQILNGKVITVFCCSQIENDWPGYEQVDDEDERYIAYMESLIENSIN